MVGKDGELYVFGKDSAHSDQYSGIVTDLKGKCIVQAAIGKAHLIALDKNGDVFSFGMNNKGQCGREFPAKKESSEVSAAASAPGRAAAAAESKPQSAAKSSAVGTIDGAAAAAASVEDGSDDLDIDSDQQVGFYSICNRDKHRWRHDQCMVCVLCGECTGYGSTCVSAGRPDRNPGMHCGCGSGDSGCAECGVCRMCAGDYDVAIDGAVGAAVDAAVGAAVQDGQDMRVTADLQQSMPEYWRARLSGNVGGNAGGGGAGGEMGPWAPVRHMFAAALGQAGAFGQQGPRGAPFHHLEHREKFIKRRLQKLGNSGGSRRSRRHTEKDKRRGIIGLNDDEVARQAERSNKERNMMALNAGAAASPAAAAAAAAAAATASASDVEKEAGKLVSLPPAKISLPKDVKVVQIASGLHHTIIRTAAGAVYAFGSNSHGQLGQCDLVPRGSPVLVPIGAQYTAASIACGSNHSVILTASGEVLTFGLAAKGQLGRPQPPKGSNAASPASVELWYAMPGAIPNIGPQFGRVATWIGGSSDQTFVKIDENLINAASMSTTSVMANSRHILLLPSMAKSNFNCLAISRYDGYCRNFVSEDQEDFSSTVANIDPLYNVLWAYDHAKQTLKSYVASAGDFAEKGSAAATEDVSADLTTIMSPELALPMSPGSLVSRNQASLNLLSCLDTLNLMPDVNLSAMEDDAAKNLANKSFTKEDFNVVNRFDSHGGGWGYSGHSIEAVRFSCDTDVLLGGFGLFGGRGEYVGKIRLFDIGTDGGEQETDGELVGESEEVTYECGARHKYPLMFEEPVALQSGRWYVAWARVSGPSSDCGSSGQTQVTTDDQVLFSFKSSKKSNNGTDVNAGQLPQLLYRIITAESASGQHKRSDPVEPVAILTGKFSRTVTAECFQALLSLVQWSWNAFKAGLCSLLEAEDSDTQQAASLDMERLIFICRASMRLIVTYVHEVYPVRVAAPGNAAASKPVPENQMMAEAVYDARTLLQTMLKDPLRAMDNAAAARSKQLKSGQRMAGLILADAHRSFVSCFHAFYPTGYLKWSCLCNLLASMEDEDANSSYDRLLTAVLDSLCSPMVKLRNTFPITYSPETETASRCRNISPSDNLSVTASMIQAGDAISTSSQQRFPVLHELMNYQSHLDGVRFASWSFREVLDRLLRIVSLPVKQALRGEPILFSRDLEEKACHLVSAVISELANETVSSESDIQNLGGRILHVTPNRFTRTSTSRTWNTGNGSPDAICFSVDRAGIFVVGCCVYGGMGTYDYELELMDDQTGGSTGVGAAVEVKAAADKEKSDVKGSQRWNSLEIAHGSYSSIDCVSDIAELRFEKPIQIRPHVKYALRLRNHGGRTSNGDSGVSSVKGPDGTSFVFSSCSLSFNGTNPTRGQLPQMLYYSSPQENADDDVQSATKSMAELYARRAALSMTATIVKTVTALLVAARESVDGEKGLQVLDLAPVTTMLMPHVFASISNLVRSDPHCAVQVLSLIQDMLPSVASLNNLAAQTLANGDASADSDDDMDNALNQGRPNFNSESSHGF